MESIIVIGGGAAGFFAAIAVAEKKESNKVIIFEKSPSVLSKVKISGGADVMLRMLVLIRNPFLKIIRAGKKN